jgi:hypothetical protein
MAVAFEGKDVSRDTIEEPAIVADDNGAAGEILERLFQRTQRIDVEIVGRFVEQQNVRARASASWRDARGCAHRPRAMPTFFCWSPPLKLNAAHRRGLHFSRLPSLMISLPPEISSQTVFLSSSESRLWST